LIQTKDTHKMRALAAVLLLVPARSDERDLAYAPPEGCTCTNDGHTVLDECVVSPTGDNPAICYVLPEPTCTVSRTSLLSEYDWVYCEVKARDRTASPTTSPAPSASLAPSASPTASTAPSVVSYMHTHYPTDGAVSDQWHIGLVLLGLCILFCIGFHYAGRLSGGEGTVPVQHGQPVVICTAFPISTDGDAALSGEWADESGLPKATPLRYTPVRMVARTVVFEVALRGTTEATGTMASTAEPAVTATTTTHDLSVIDRILAFVGLGAGAIGNTATV